MSAEVMRYRRDSDDFSSALAAFAEILGRQRVLVGDEAVGRYGASTLGVARSIPAVLQVLTTAEVQRIVRVASDHRVSIYPISTGNNWGYGSANPVMDGSVVLDLSGMNRIVACDPELGTVTVQPGVTQQILYDDLADRGLDLLVPTHGGGPDCSIMGNALERGYGLTPHTDHFGAVTRLEAVLPSGELYRPALSGLGGREVDGVFKWGIGPYLDGLFSQGSFGIVTEMTIALCPRPETTEAFFFWVADDAGLEQAVHGVRDVLSTYRGVTGSINLMNARRVLSMVAPYPHDRVAAGEIMPDELVDRMARRYQVPAWTGFGGLYGPRRLVRSARRDIRRILRRSARRVLFVNRRVESVLRRATSLAPAVLGRLAASVRAIGDGLDVLEGRPSRVALPLAYCHSGVRPADDRDMNPARDGCGLAWYAPLVPMKGARVREFVDHVERVCRGHGVEPLITLTGLTPGCFDSTIPIIFDRANPVAATNARACHRQLFEEGCSLGFVPYRCGVDQMGHLVDPEAPFWRLVGTLKAAIDPHSLIAPGRYAPAAAWRDRRQESTSAPSHRTTSTDSRPSTGHGRRPTTF